MSAGRAPCRLTYIAADDAEGQARLAAFTQALSQFGWSEGRNLRIDTLLWPLLILTYGYVAVAGMVGVASMAMRAANEPINNSPASAANSVYKVQYVPPTAQVYFSNWSMRSEKSDYSG